MVLATGARCDCNRVRQGTAQIDAGGGIRPPVERTRTRVVVLR